MWACKNYKPLRMTIPDNCMTNSDVIVSRYLPRWIRPAYPAAGCAGLHNAKIAPWGGEGGGTLDPEAESRAGGPGDVEVDTGG